MYYHSRLLSWTSFIKWAIFLNYFSIFRNSWFEKFIFYFIIFLHFLLFNKLKFSNVLFLSCRGWNFSIISNYEIVTYDMEFSGAGKSDLVMATKMILKFIFIFCQVFFCALIKNPQVSLSTGIIEGISKEENFLGKNRKWDEFRGIRFEND